MADATTVNPLVEQEFVPDAAIAFLTVVVILLLLVIMFFLYLSKALCFTNCGGCPCMEEGKKEREKKPKQDLEGSYGYDEDESSSDSDDEMLLKYQQSLSVGRFSRQPSVTGYKKKSVAAASRAPSESLGSRFLSRSKMSASKVYSPD